MPNLKVFEDLKNTNSVVEKQDILNKSVDDLQLAELLRRNLNPYMLFYIRKLPEYTQGRPIWQSGDKAYSKFIELSDKLSSRELTGNAARDAVKVFMAATEPDEAKVYAKVLLKAPIGVGAKTVNKVWPKLVPSFEVMLAPNELPDITKVLYPAYIQPKLDGFRCIYKEGYFIGRSGIPIANNNIPDHFESLLGVKDWVLDGELYDHTITCQKLSKILNADDVAIPATVKFTVYDAIPLADWNKKKCVREYQDRLKDIRKVLASVGDYKKVIDIANDKVNTSKEVKDLYKDYLEDGYEGAMIKDPHGLYRWKRVTIKSGEMLKVKPFKSVDLEITGFYDGEGKNEGKTGGFVVSYNGCPVRVGSGLTDLLREQVSKQPASYLGKTIEVKYLEETEDGSLRHPTFKQFREDKD